MSAISIIARPGNRPFCRSFAQRVAAGLAAPGAEGGVGDGKLSRPPCLVHMPHAAGILVDHVVGTVELEETGARKRMAPPPGLDPAPPVVPGVQHAPPRRRF